MPLCFFGTTLPSICNNYSNGHNSWRVIEDANCIGFVGNVKWLYLSNFETCFTNVVHVTGFVSIIPKIGRYINNFTR